MQNVNKRVHQPPTGPISNLPNWINWQIDCVQLFYPCPYFILARLTSLESYSQLYNNIHGTARMQWRDSILYFQK